MSNARYDLVTIGRANLDLYARQVGAPFEEIESFDAMVGGSPTNIAIGAARLGLDAAALTAVGDDRVGDFVVHNLDAEGVDTRFIPRKIGRKTSLALLGVQPPDQFPLSFYREDPADIHLEIEDIAGLSLGSYRAVLVSGTALSRGACAETTRWLLRRAGDEGIPVYLDLDLRPTEWSSVDEYSVAMQEVADDVSVVVGTEEEMAAALPGGEASDLLDAGASVVVVKRGAVGASVLTADADLDVPGFPVEVLNTVGAGDAFASGLIRSRLAGEEWPSAVRFANACGAIVVTRHGCSSALPTGIEVEAFLTAVD